MSIREINFPSANGRDTIKAWAYTPLGKPRAVIQLIHGFGEHSRRYLHMISKFQAAGFVVYADDHIGHGKTGFNGGTLGDPHSGGYMTYLRDEKYLHDIAHMAYPDLPFFVFGHSWGSMLGRAYAALYGDDLAGLMLCGLVSQFKGCEIEYNDPAIRAAVAADPYQPSGEWFGKVFLGMTDRIVDITATGATLRDNDLVITGRIMDCTARFFVNPGAARLDQRVRNLADRLAAAVKDKHFEPVAGSAQ